MIVFDGIFHKIINSTVEKKIASGNGAVTLFLDQFHFFLVSNGGKIAADFIGEFCQWNKIRAFNGLYPGHIEKALR